MSYREREHTLVWVDYLIPHVIWCRFIASSKHARSYYQHHSLIVSWLISHFFSWRMSLFSSPPKTIGLSKYRILNISLHSFNHHKQLIVFNTLRLSDIHIRQIIFDHSFNHQNESLRIFILCYRTTIEKYK